MAVQPTALDGWHKLLPRLHVGGIHRYVPTGKEGVQFLLPLLTPAVLHHGVDELIYSRLLREVGNPVAQSLEVLFGHVVLWCRVYDG